MLTRRIRQASLQNRLPLIQPRTLCRRILLIAVIKSSSESQEASTRSKLLPLCRTETCWLA
jgi:hypothetical protein